MPDIPGTRIVRLLDGEMFRVPDNWTDPVDIEAARVYRQILKLRRIVPKFGYWPESKNEDGGTMEHRSMKLMIEIQIGNDAAQNYDDLGRIIQKLCMDEFVGCPHEPREGEGYPVRDANGNQAGNWSIEA